MFHCQDLSNIFCSECKEYSVFRELLWIVFGLEGRLMNSSEEEVIEIADLVCQP